MKVIRKGVFETNSSSTHSITLGKESKLLTSLYVDPDGCACISGKGFGWGWQVYDDAESKAAYCYAYAQRDQDLVDRLINLIKEHTGAKSVIFEGEFYIDHRSDEVCGCAFENDEALENFIFNKESYLYTGNDNEAEPPNFYDKDLSIFTHRVYLEYTTLPYLILESQIHDESHLSYVVQTLWGHTSLKEYSLDLNGFDFQNKTLSVCKYEYVYGQDGKYLRKDVVDKKLLKFNIRKI